MTVALQRGMTLEEFLAWDEGQEDRWEFDGFQPVAMVRGTVAHARLCRNLAVALTARLRGTPCEAFGEGLKIAVAGSIRYPDAFVACGPNANQAIEAMNPVVVFEVLSPGTASTDIVVKNREYQATPSIRRYVILMQDRIAATVSERRGIEWVVTFLTDPAAVLEMPEIGIGISLAEFYEGVIEFAPSLPGDGR